MPIETRLMTISQKRIFDRCPKQYDYRVRRQLEPLETAEPLERGTLFHEDAEAAHSGIELEREMTSGGEAYRQWVKEHEEFETIATEIPIVLPLIRLIKYAHELTDANMSISQGSFAGVIDLIGSHKRDGTRWIIDHKSLKRFYPYPLLYSTEQLYLYYLAHHLSSGPTLLQQRGVALSRVLTKPITSEKHFQNYIIRHLKATLGAEKLTLTQIRDWSKGIKVQENTLSTNSTLSTISTNKRIRIELNKEPKNISTKKYKYIKSINIYSTIPPSAGYLTTSISKYGKTLVHVERQFYVPSPEELRNIVRDYLQFIRAEGTGDDRRSPGLHCQYCPYQIPCEMARRGQPEPLEAFCEVPPAQEVLRAIERKGKKEPISERI